MIQRFFLMSAAVLALLAVAAPPASAGTPARASVTCSLAGYHRSLGTTYVHWLIVTGISCRSGRSAVRSYHACRRSNGGTGGRCTTFGAWRCAEFRRTIRQRLEATASCRSGVPRVVHAYTQSL